MENAIYILSLEEGIVHRSDTSYGIHTSCENEIPRFVEMPHMEQVLMFYHLKTRHFVNIVHK